MLVAADGTLHDSGLCSGVMRSNGRYVGYQLEWLGSRSDDLWLPENMAGMYTSVNTSALR